MKIKYELEKVEIDDEIICVPIGAGAEEVHGVLKLNNTGYEIVKLLEKDMTVDQLTEVLSSNYDTDYQTIRSYVEKTINVLKDNLLID